MANATSQSDTRTKVPALSGAAGIIALALLVLLALPLLWGAATRLLALLGYPYPHDGLEGTLLYEARLLLAGEPLYQPLERRASYRHPTRRCTRCCWGGPTKLLAHMCFGAAGCSRWRPRSELLR